MSRIGEISVDEGVSIALSVKLDSAVLTGDCRALILDSMPAHPYRPEICE